MAIARRLQLAGLMAIQVVVVWQIVGLAYHEVSLSKPVWIQGPSNVVSLTKTSSDTYQMLSSPTITCDSYESCMMGTCMAAQSQKVNLVALMPSQAFEENKILNSNGVDPRIVDRCTDSWAGLFTRIRKDGAFVASIALAVIVTLVNSVISILALCRPVRVDARESEANGDEIDSSMISMEDGSKALFEAQHKEGNGNGAALAESKPLLASGESRPNPAFRWLMFVPFVVANLCSMALIGLGFYYIYKHHLENPRSVFDIHAASVGLLVALYIPTQFSVGYDIVTSH